MIRLRACIAVVAITVYLIPLRAQAFPQAGPTLAGTVRDQNGAVVPKADVELLNVASGRILKTTTDDSGKYQFVNVLTATYQLSVNSRNFAATTRSISIRQNGSYTEDFVLLPGLIKTETTITAAKGGARMVHETPQAITVTDESQIEMRRPWSTQRAIQMAPNLTPVISNPMLERPRLRGLASNRLLVILDGERLNNMRSDPTSGVSPSVVDVTQLQSAEVLSGAGSSLYGSDAMAGVINLITTGQSTTEYGNYLGVRLNGDVTSNGPFRRGAAAINWSNERLALRINGSVFRQDNYSAGKQDISLDEVVRLGRLAVDMGNVVGNNVARTFAVWSLNAGDEISNAQARGFNDQVDLWFYSGPNESFRYRQLNSHHKNLGFSFITPPFDPRRQFNSFRRLDKYGFRYERRELSIWFQRLAAAFYRQKYSFPDDTITSSIVLDSSWTFEPTPDGLLPILTGNRSTFAAANISNNKNSITTYFGDLQATLIPFPGVMITTGLGYLRDSSADEFSRTDLTPPFRVITDRASNPDSVYRNWGWFTLFEHEPTRWLRLIGGLRVDNWRTEARVTQGFPLGPESTLLDLSFADLIADPGPINTSGAAAIIDLVRGVRGITTSRTVVTGNAGFVLRLASGINPYFRWGNSYREPGITERYLLRDFGDPTFSVLVIPNAALRPERGREYDFGVKVQRARWNASAGYFVNDLRDFIGSAFGPLLFVPPDPARGLDPISPFFPFHGVLYVQRTNTARARIKGFEATYEASLQLGRAGVITPFGSLGWLKGSNLTPDENTLNLIARFYNRDDTAVPLSGSADDAPLTSITPFRTLNGIRFDDAQRRWFAEYELRYQARVKRADPLDLSAAISTEYGTLASLNSFSVQAVRGGFTRRQENYRMTISFGIENLTNRLYFEHFQTAPAPGRSVVFGTTLEFFNLMGK